MATMTAWRATVVYPHAPGDEPAALAALADRLPGAALATTDGHATLVEMDVRVDDIHSATVIALELADGVLPGRVVQSVTITRHAGLLGVA